MENAIVNVLMRLVIVMIESPFCISISTNYELTLGQNDKFYQKNRISKISFFTKFISTYSRNPNFHIIHISQISFFTKFKLEY